MALVNVHTIGRPLAGILLITVLLGAGSCQSYRRPIPDLGSIYDEVAQRSHEERNPVVVIPGLLGTRLVNEEDGRVVWGAFTGTFANPRTPDGARLAAVPMERGTPLSELGDDVVPDSVLSRIDVDVFGVPVQMRAYSHLLSALGVGGFRDETLGLSGAVDYGEGHFTCFQFPYDFRLDNAENAKRFKAFLDEKKAYVESELKKRYGMSRDVKFDIVAHSMGGLLARYFLRYGDAELPESDAPEPTWAGAEYIERLIMVGPPNAGSVESLDSLANGKKFGPFTPSYPAAVLGTMPAMYQLLPRARHKVVTGADGETLDLFDIETWDTYSWGLADPEQDAVLEMLLPEVETRTARREVALDHLRKCLVAAERFQRALDAPSAPPAGVEMYLMASDAVKTPSHLEVAPDGSLAVTEHGAGDGTVLRSSVLLDERVGGDWHYQLQTPIYFKDAMFIFTDHLGLTRSPEFTDNVLYLLLEHPRRDVGRERGE